LSIADEIRKIAAKRKAVILAHNYQPAEIQELADHAGDSYGLSVIASKVDAEVIVFCGVHFMAESAAILSPEKKVILPEKEAGCPLADMIRPEDVAGLKEKYPGLPVVAYVNTSAGVKAMSDYCCTSSNAVAVLQQLPDDRVIFVPDRNLADWAAKKSGKKVIPWQGFCPVHEDVSLEDVQSVRREHPEAPFIAHPECRPEVVALADHVTSTSGFFSYVASSPATSFIIGTEKGILHRLKKENPGKKFYEPRLEMICPSMKLITLESILSSLEKLDNIVTVPSEVADRARKALERMVSISG
jgi:quinolinate synthase